MADTKRNRINQLIDQDGVLYGLKKVDNKLRTSSMPYLYDIAEEHVVNHTIHRVEGYNAGVPNGTFEDVTTLSANVVRLAAGIQMETDSSSAQDAGVTIYTSTATGGTATTLVDTVQDFTAGAVVAVGDLILLDDDVELGYVTGVAATTLTCSNGFSGGVVPAAGDNYRVVDVSAGGTGIQAVKVHGLDGDYDEVDEFVVLNGLGAVATVGTDYLRVNSYHAILVGTSLSAVGTVDLQSVGGATDYARIPIGQNTASQAMYTVPNNYTAYVTSWSGSASSLKGVQLILLATCEWNNRYAIQPFITQDSIIAESSTVQIIFPGPLKFRERVDIKVMAMGLGGVAESAAAFGFWQELND